MTNYQARAKDRAGNAVPIGPVVGIRNAALNAILAHRVDAEIVADDAVIVTTVTFVNNRPVIEHLVPEVEGEGITGYTGDRNRQSRRRGPAVKW